MRDYAKVSPNFWIGETSRKLKKLGAEAQVLAFYLVTSPHANMLGLYHLPIAYIVADTGLNLQGAMKALASLSEAHFCDYDEASETIWVYEMAKFQVGEFLKKTDNQILGVNRNYQNLHENKYLYAFFKKYQFAFHLSEARGNSDDFEAPYKPLVSQEQEQEQDFRDDQIEKKSNLRNKKKSGKKTSKSAHRSKDSTCSTSARTVREKNISRRTKTIIDETMAKLTAANTLKTKNEVGT